MRVTIRPARPEDSEAIGRVHIAAWQAAYRGLMPDEFLDGLDGTARGERWHSALSAGPGEGRYREGDLEGGGGEERPAEATPPGRWVEERAGWQPDGARHEDCRRGFEVIEVRYRRAL